MPCASGRVVALGSRELSILPLMDDVEDPISLLPPEAALVILHPKAVQAIMSIAKEKGVREAWRLTVFTPRHLSDHLAAVLPLSWHRPDLESRGRSDGLHPPPSTRPAASQQAAAAAAAAHQAARGRGGLSVPWMNGDQDGSPSPWWLGRTWGLILALLRAGEGGWV